MPRKGMGMGGSAPPPRCGTSPARGGTCCARDWNGLGMTGMMEKMCPDAEETHRDTAESGINGLLN